MYEKDTKGTLSWLCRKCMTAIGQLLIQVQSNMRRPTFVCTLLPWTQKKNTIIQSWSNTHTAIHIYIELTYNFNMEEMSK